MEPWRGLLRSVVAVSHHFDEDLDPDPRQSESSDWISLKAKSRIWIRNKFDAIRNASSSLVQKLCFWNILNPDLVLNPG